MDKQRPRRTKLLFPSQPHSQSLPNQLQQGSISDRLPATVRLCLDLVRDLSGINKQLAMIMLSTGCRANEVLNITVRDIYPTGHIFIRASKRSQSRVVYYPDLIHFAVPHKRPYDHKVFGFHHYCKFYRSVRRLLSAGSPRSRVRRKVTNLFRCAAADIARLVSQGDPDIATIFLGHKSTRSTESYTQIKEQPNG